MKLLNFWRHILFLLFRDDVTIKKRVKEEEKFKWKNSTMKLICSWKKSLSFFFSFRYQILSSLWFNLEFDKKNWVVKWNSLHNLLIKSVKEDDARSSKQAARPERWRSTTTETSRYRWRMGLVGGVCLICNSHRQWVIVFLSVPIARKFLSILVLLLIAYVNSHWPRTLFTNVDET